MTPPHTVPIIPGWDTRAGGENTTAHIIATRRTPLTEYQRLYGALHEITARDHGELWLLCDAQTRLAERLATAEGITSAPGEVVIGVPPGQALSGPDGP